MAGEIEEGKEFSNNIDRILAGQEVEIGEGVSEDYKTAAQFAQKLHGLGDEPSPHFKDRLRSRLLLKLAEREAEKQREKRNWFWEAVVKLVPRSAVWRTATVTIVVAVLAVVVFWGGGIFTQPPEQVAERGPTPAMAPPSKTTPEEAPAVTLDSGAILGLEPAFADSGVYPLGEEVEIDLAFRNALSETIIVAPFPPAVQIIRVDTGEVVRSFPSVNERAEVSACGTLNYTLVWDQLDDNGEQIEPGRYSIIVSDVTVSKGTEPRESNLSFERVTELIIQSPK